jgi:hypothetical protein
MTADGKDTQDDIRTGKTAESLAVERDNRTFY